MYRKHFSLTRHPFAKDLSPEELFVAGAGRELDVRLGHLLELRGIGPVTGEAGRRFGPSRSSANHSTCAATSSRSCAC
jgi:hypothetical protein